MDAYIVRKLNELKEKYAQLLSDTQTIEYELDRLNHLDALTLVAQLSTASTQLQELSLLISPVAAKCCTGDKDDSDTPPTTEKEDEEWAYYDPAKHSVVWQRKFYESKPRTEFDLPVKTPSTNQNCLCSDNGGDNGGGDPQQSRTPAERIPAEDGYDIEVNASCANFRVMLSPERYFAEVDAVKNLRRTHFIIAFDTYEDVAAWLNSDPFFAVEYAHYPYIGVTTREDLATSANNALKNEHQDAVYALTEQGRMYYSYVGAAGTHNVLENATFTLRSYFYDDDTLIALGSGTIPHRFFVMFHAVTERRTYDVPDSVTVCFRRPMDAHQVYVGTTVYPHQYHRPSQFTAINLTDGYGDNWSISGGAYTILLGGHIDGRLED